MVVITRIVVSFSFASQTHNALIRGEQIEGTKLNYTIKFIEFNEL